MLGVTTTVVFDGIDQGDAAMSSEEVAVLDAPDEGELWQEKVRLAKMAREDAKMRRGNRSPVFPMNWMLSSVQK
jgi:hypothetical protein